MKKLLVLALLLAPLAALPQSAPNGPIVLNQIWTPAQWNAAWEAKVDVTGGVLYSPAINGQVDIGSETSSSTAPIVMHSSGHAGGDASISVSGGTGANPISGISRFGYIAPLAWVIRRRQQRARELRRWKRDDASGLILLDYKRVA